MTINNFTFFSPNGTEFPVGSNNDAKLYMMLTGMDYKTIRRKDWLTPTNSGLNVIYNNTSIIAGGRYFELSFETVALNANSVNYIHANIDLTQTTRPVSLSAEKSDNSNSIDLNNASGVLKVLIDIRTTNGTDVTLQKAPDNVTYLDKAVINSVISSITVDSGQVKTATINTGYGRSAVITRIGNTVTITSQSQYSSEPADGSWQRGVGTLPVGFRPATETLIYNHDLTIPSKFSWNLLHTNGLIDLFSNGNIKTTDYILTSGQFWITKDKLPE